MKNELNVFHYGYHSHKPKYWFSNIKQFFTNIKYAYQRATKGFCTHDVWDLDTYYARLISSSLKEFRQNISKFSYNVTEDKDIDNTDRWDYHIWDIEQHFLNYLDEAYTEKEQIVELQKGIEMLKESWTDLWD